MISSVLALVVVLSVHLINLSRCRSNGRLPSAVSMTDSWMLDGFGVMLLRYFPSLNQEHIPELCLEKQMVLLIACQKYPLSFMHNLQSHAKHPPPIAFELLFSSEGTFLDPTDLLCEE